MLTKTARTLLMGVLGLALPSCTSLIGEAQASTKIHQDCAQVEPVNIALLSPADADAWIVAPDAEGVDMPQVDRLDEQLSAPAAVLLGGVPVERQHQQRITL